ncbi:flagellar filament capping protein FliD [Ruminococcus sp. HUN007]|uniref:flagellar filament capping protein FliD n=1 Tax=Ruminococcus sp. HUN007 TaxID=1514668 RepID=UPI0005D21984|nr:flagellar filament capping protein FliD [Ruminococcus sp. HUN007]
MQVSSSSENTYTNASYSNKGISGMNSGLDTESLVKSMMSDMQTKIDKQEQQQKVLEMKQDQYREVIDKINDFRGKYFSVTGEKTLALTSSFKSTTTESTSSAVKAVSTADAVEGSFDVEVIKLASEAKFTSSVSASQGMNVKAGGELMSASAAKMTISVGGTDIEVDVSGAASASDMADKINKGITTYNRQNSSSAVDVSVSVGSDGKLKFSGTGASTDISVNGSSATVKNASVTSGKFDKSKLSADAKDYTFKLNGKDVTVNLSKNDSDEDILSKINAQVSGKGITVSYDGTGDDKKLKFTGNSDVEKITIEAASDSNDLKALGFSGKQEASRTSEVSADVPAIESKGKLNITFNGVSKDISLTSTDTADSFSEKLFQAFGSGIHFDADSGEITAGTGKNIKIKGDESSLEFIGMDSKGATNQLDTSMTLKDLYGYNDSDKIEFSINGTDFSFTGDTKLSDMMTEVNESRAGVTITYNSLNDKFSIKGQETGSGSVIEASDSDENGILKKMFGTSSISKQGTDAHAVIDGEDVFYSGNELKYNGINLTLKNVTNGPVNIETTNDNDKVLDNIVSFVEDYNALIKDLNDRTHEKAEYKQYMPLTDAQKDEMTESEIKKWEEKTNKGLLSGDNDISSFLNEMRTVLYTKVGDKKLLSEIGIESSSDWKDYGKLTINKDKLKDAIQNDAKGVADIFTGSNGIASRLDSACKKAANTSSGSPGSLVSLAGLKGKATEKNNTISKRIDTIKETIKKLKEQYDSRKERLWKQFNSMESALGNMNSTANYFASMIGGGF